LHSEASDPLLFSRVEPRRTVVRPLAPSTLKAVFHPAVPVEPVSEKADAVVVGAFLRTSHQRLLGWRRAMTAPHHLWSGDWQGDSAATAEELARRRAKTDRPTGESVPAQPPGPPGASRPARRLLRPAPARAEPRQPRQRSQPRSTARLPGALVLVLAMLVSAGAAFAGVLTLFGSHFP
jgi:hypothetical protein